MGLLDKLLGSNLQLSRPDFDRTPELELNYSGLTLRFRDAPHSAMSPPVDYVEHLDLRSASHFSKSKSGGYGKMIYDRSWELRGRRGTAIGGVGVTAALLLFPHFSSEGRSCFRKRDFEAEVLRCCHNSWGWLNEGAELGSLGNAAVNYPTRGDQLHYVEIGDSCWCKFDGRKSKGKPPRMGYMMPVSDQNILSLEFAFSAYGRVDFYGPETNLKETCAQIEKDFMENFHVELSDEAKAQKQAVQALEA